MNLDKISRMRFLIACVCFLGMMSLLVSCSNDADTPLPSEKKEYTITLGVAVDVDDESLTTALLSDLRAVTLKPEGGNAYPRIKPWSDGAEEVFTICFTDGENTVERQVTLPYDATTHRFSTERVEVSLPNFSPTKTWYASCILGTTKSFSSRPYKAVGELTSTELSIPYASPWTPLAYQGKYNHTTEDYVRLRTQMKPLGALLRLQVHNKRGVKQMLRGFRVEGEGITTNAQLSFDASLENVKKSTYPTITSSTTEVKDILLASKGLTTYEGEAGEDIENNASTSVYWLWVGRVSSATNASQEAVVSAIHYRVGIPWYYRYKVPIASEHGVSTFRRLVIPNDNKIYRKIQLLDLLQVVQAEVPLPVHSVAVTGYPTIPMGMHALTGDDWASILPISNRDANTINNDGGRGQRYRTKYFYERNISRVPEPFGAVVDYAKSEGSNTYTSSGRYTNGTSSYYGTGGGSLAALRHISTPLPSAYRYTMVFKSSSTHLAVELVPLKTTNIPTIGTVSDGFGTTFSWWTRAKEYGEINARLIPLANITSNGGPIYLFAGRSTGGLSAVSVFSPRGNNAAHPSVILHRINVEPYFSSRDVRLFYRTDQPKLMDNNLLW